ncbi:hypothetical protein IC614_06375 [Allosphingosinicella flava]|uniref:Uncharacterized protein n=1 Tax=Allosphingosinicella flava TaxID=2771430 RepID=A0A7T2GHL5_9SPHN|nr:hypothetical protein [Sphingosinicella flava]QPQ54004.1 hypothetical protein IC614_06375 [Sphingosinicella flava]
MMALQRDASSELLRAIRRRAGDRATLAIENLSSRPWASATFSGARHHIAFRIEGDHADDMADALLTGIEAAEFTLRGHIVADIIVLGRDLTDRGAVRIRLEALTVEDA